MSVTPEKARPIEKFASGHGLLSFSVPCEPMFEDNVCERQRFGKDVTQREEDDDDDEEEEEGTRRSGRTEVFHVLICSFLQIFPYPLPLISTS